MINPRSALDVMPVTRDHLMAKPLYLSPDDRLEVVVSGHELDSFELRLTSTPDAAGRPRMPSSAARHDFTQRFPQRKVVAGTFDCRWTVAATDVSALVIRYCWPESQVTFSSEASIVYSYLLASISAASATARRTFEYHDRHRVRQLSRQLAAVSPMPETTELANGMRLMEHQQTALENSLDAEGYALFMEQGTGKTATVIARVDAEATRLKSKTGRAYRAIIVAPKNVRVNWACEFEKFSTVRGRVTVLRGGGIERIKQIIEALAVEDDEAYTVIVCSYETLWGSWDAIGSVEWDLAVLDEAHYIKWPRTKRAVFCHRLRDISRQRMVLTGTPVCNTPIDLYSQLEFLRKGASGFTSFEAFRSFYGVFAVNDQRAGVKRLVDVQNLPFMRERISQLAFVVRKEDALPDLPSKLYDVREVEMSKPQAEAYRAVRDQLYLEIKSEMADAADQGKTLNANNILTRLLRLAQITSGFIVFDAVVDPETGEELRPKTTDRYDPNPKLEELIAMLRSTEPDEKMIVWACFVQDIKSIEARLEIEGVRSVTYYGGTSDVDRAEAERAFNTDPDCKVFVGNPGAGGTGLNLLGYPPGSPDEYDTDCTHVVYFSQDWSSPKRSQSEDRAHRRGTRRPVQITDLCVPNTIDEEIRARVTNKRLVALQVQDVQNILSRVLGREV